MRVSRTPENRGGAGSPVILVVVLVALFVVGGIVVYLLLDGRMGGETTVQTPSGLSSAPQAQGAITQLTPPTPVPLPTPPPPAPVEPSAPVDATSTEFVPPNVFFGEVVAQGTVDLELLSGRYRAWYTLQVDTSTQGIIMYYGLFDPARGRLSRTVLVEDYSQAELISNALVTVYYEDGPERVLEFDREAGTVLSRQFYSAQPQEPSMFSPQMRIALVHQQLALQNAGGDIRAELQIDHTGVSDREGIAVLQTNPELVNNALSEIQLVIDQIESRRPR